mmetsp:Transcript_37491/g.117179  ORF Transcript_37491/g.117179 Transcript_37491/m.117179 type:complete len:979 (-) Transcript_37491:49-2985(-)
MPRYPNRSGGVVQYLLRSYDAAKRAASTPLRGKQAAKEETRQEALGVARAAIVTYFHLTATNPGIWASDAEVDGMEAFVTALQNPGIGLPRGFVEHLVRHLMENEELGSFVGVLMDVIADKIAEPGQDLTGVNLALANLCAQKDIAREMAATHHFQLSENVTGATLFSDTLLGKLFFHNIPREAFVLDNGSNLVASQADPELARPGDMQQLDRILRQQRVVAENGSAALHGLVRTMLKEPTLRDAVLNWMGRACDLNMDKLKTAVAHGMSEANVSPDLCMLSMLRLLLKLCEPFSALDSPKGAKLAAKVDLAFMTSGLRFSVAKDDRLALSGEKLDRWLDERNLARIQQFQAREEAEREAKAGSGAPGTPGGAGADDGKSFGTVSEFFGLTSRVAHLTVNPILSRYRHVHRVIERMQDELKKRKQAAAGGGMNAAMHTMAIATLTAKLQEHVLWSLQMNALLFNPDLVTPLLDFMRLQAYSICAAAAREAGQPGPHVASIPLPPPPDDSLVAALPDHVVEDVTEVLTFGSHVHVNPRTHRGLVDEMSRDAKEDFLQLIVVFGGAPKHVRNPYLRARLIEALAIGLTPTDEKRRGGHAELAAIFEASPLAAAHLAPMLLRFFVDIEFTGSHTQFYDKFRYRRLAGSILEFLWDMAPYRATLVEASRDVEFFVGFVNMIVNDTIYHMDEALTQIKKVKDLQTRLADATHDWGNPAEMRRERDEQLLEQTTNHAKSELEQANGLTHMLSYLSAEPAVREPFMTDDMRSRIAEMLNYFLLHLTGPRQTDLRINNMEELDFRPDEMLAKLATIYANFSANDGFAASVASDQRSYNPAYFSKAVRVLRRTGKVSQDVVDRFEAFATAADAEAQRLAAEEEDLGEVPEEFLDPLTYELMRDPVRLPTSNVTMDRANIKRHLLSDHTDPFNRQHLTIDMLEDDVELKAKIDAWIAAQKAKSGAGGAPPAPADDAMDVAPPEPPAEG